MTHEVDQTLLNFASIETIVDCPDDSTQDGEIILIIKATSLYFPPRKATDMCEWKDICRYL